MAVLVLLAGAAGAVFVATHLLDPAAGRGAGAGLALARSCRGGGTALSRLGHRAGRQRVGRRPAWRGRGVQGARHFLGLLELALSFDRISLFLTADANVTEELDDLVLNVRQQ